MESLIINGGKKLYGNLKIQCAKNALLPIMAASVLAEQNFTLFETTPYQDVVQMQKIIENLGGKIQIKESDIFIDNSLLNNYEIDKTLSQTIRASIFLVGPLLSRFKKAIFYYPGGCNIGSRPIDIHLDGLKSLGVKITYSDDKIECDGSNMKAGKVHFNFPSVGATENIILASLYLKGITTISNAAKEPEIINLCEFLNGMGAKISGAGSDVITIEGVKHLQSINFTVMSDRIIFGTYAMMIGITGGKVTFENVRKQDNLPLIELFKNSNLKMNFIGNNCVVECDKKLIAIPLIESNPYPSFPTDLQNQALTLMTTAQGISLVIENIFENRFNVCKQLEKMGADVVVKQNCCLVSGVDYLAPSQVYATDLRAGASLIMAGLSCNGQTVVKDIHHIDRGYYQIEKDLSTIGADIKRVDIN